MVLLPLPFYLLAIGVGSVDGKEVDEHQLEILDQSIKGVSQDCIGDFEQKLT
jgi:hypothetical protein